MQELGFKVYICIYLHALVMLSFLKLLLYQSVLFYGNDTDNFLKLLVVIRLRVEMIESSHYFNLRCFSG